MKDFLSGLLLGVLYGAAIHMLVSRRVQTAEIHMPEISLNVEGDDDDGGEYSGNYGWLN